MVKAGDHVTVHYTGTLNDGKEFDSSVGREPLQFTVGDGSMIPGFDKAVVGMKVGESKKFTIPAEEAYGPVQEEMVITVPKDQLPPGMDPKVGDKLEMGSPAGDMLIVTVTETTDTTMTVDGNHDLAGQDLTFDIKLIKCN